MSAVVALGLATVLPGNPLCIIDNGVSRRSIGATWWRLVLWPSNTLIGDAQDVAIDVMNLIVLNLVASPGRTLAAVFLLLACCLVAALSSACALAAAFGLVFARRRYLSRARKESENP